MISAYSIRIDFAAQAAVVNRQLYHQRNRMLRLLICRDQSCRDDGIFSSPCRIFGRMWSLTIRPTSSLRPNRKSNPSQMVRCARDPHGIAATCICTPVIVTAVAPARRGKSVPCPVFVTAEAAMRRGLDFIAITDHNTCHNMTRFENCNPTSTRCFLFQDARLRHSGGMRHAFGITNLSTIALARPACLTSTPWPGKFDRFGGMISINHPNDAKRRRLSRLRMALNPPADLRLFSAIEAMNGGALRGPYSGISYWEKQLEEGYRIPAIGGSDNHHGDWPFDHARLCRHSNDRRLCTKPIGAGDSRWYSFRPCVYRSDRLPQSHAGHDCFDAREADCHDGRYIAGAFRLCSSVTVHVVGCSGWTLKMLDNDHENSALSSQLVSQDDATLHLTWPSDGKQHWLLPRVETPQGELEVLGNPIYVNYFGKDWTRRFSQRIVSEGALSSCPESLLRSVCCCYAVYFFTSSGLVAAYGDSARNSHIDGCAQLLPLRGLVVRSDQSRHFHRHSSGD